jgi:hypothetical protein
LGAPDDEPPPGCNDTGPPAEALPELGSEVRGVGAGARSLVFGARWVLSLERSGSRGAVVRGGVAGSRVRGAIGEGSLASENETLLEGSP